MENLILLKNPSVINKIDETQYNSAQQQLEDQAKQGYKEYFQKLYRKNKIKKRQALNSLFKKNILDD